MVVLGMHQRRFRTLEPAGLDLCYTQGVGNSVESCQSQEGFGSESGERGLALEGPGHRGTGYIQRKDHYPFKKGTRDQGS